MPSLLPRASSRSRASAGAAASRNFDRAYVRCGSSATEALGPTPRRMSASPRKRPFGYHHPIGRMPSCRHALRCLGSQLLCRRCQADGLEPVRTSQRNLHHQLLRSGILITYSSRAGMPRRDRFGHFAPDWSGTRSLAASAAARAASGHAAATSPRNSAQRNAC
jgi:hypothetical protein